MKKECRIIMLPFELSEGEYSPYTIFKGTDRFFYVNIKTPYFALKDAQHLYFTSDDKIKVGDWIYSLTHKNVRRADKIDIEQEIPVAKIVASTDPSLELPSIPLQWIKDVYVPANGEIDRAWLQQEEWNTVNNSEISREHLLKNRWDYVKSELPESPFNDAQIHFYERLKFTDNNEVIIVDESMSESMNDFINIIKWIEQECAIKQNRVMHGIQSVASSYEDLYQIYLKSK